MAAEVYLIAVRETGPAGAMERCAAMGTGSTTALHTPQHAGLYQTPKMIDHPTWQVAAPMSTVSCSRRLIARCIR